MTTYLINYKYHKSKGCYDRRAPADSCDLLFLSKQMNHLLLNGMLQVINFGYCCIYIEFMLCSNKISLVYRQITGNLILNNKLCPFY